MNITEKAKEYAKGKAMEAITAAIEQAYADGYNDGINHLENEKLEAIKTGVEYRNLGLKTQWSSKLIKYKEANFIKPMPYIEASKLNLPTKEQFEELCRVCFAEHVKSKDRAGIELTGITGEKILIGYWDDDQIAFWLKDDEDSNERLIANVKIEKNKATPIYKKVYMGLQMPVMIVREELKR